LESETSMINGLFRKGFILGIILFFILAGIIPSTVGIIKEKNVIMNLGSRGYIQDLIDNASDGDTIYISSGIYYENIIINKSISLIGEDKNTTIIDGSGTGDVVYIKADWVNISGFTIRNGGGAGIDIDSNYNMIQNNTISNNNCGIYLIGASFNNLTYNNITSNNGNGMSLGSSNYNTITENTITSNNDNGIFLRLSDYNTIIGNIISNKNNGVYIGGSNHNNITGNTSSKNTFGILLRFLIIWSHNFPSRKNNITKNNFLGYRQLTYCGGDWSNFWSENYWNRPRIFPKLIFGAVLLGFAFFEGIPIVIPWFNVDWYPAFKPYDI